MTKRVLCAVDIGHPDQERHLLKRAAQLADMDDAELDVLNVIPGFGMSVVGMHFPEGIEQKMVDHTNASLHAFIEETLGPDRDRHVGHIVAEGSVYKEILRVATEIGANLIVIGAHHPDLRDFLLGPNADRVARHADCSVYIVRM